MPVLGKPLLSYQLERLRSVQSADDVVVATTTNATDEPIVELCRELDIPYVRGSETDVLDRYWQTAKQHQADVVVRVTSDCPLIDPGVIDELMTFYVINAHQYDYVSNVLENRRTYPRGLDAEVFPFGVLDEIKALADEPAYREHVTLYIYRHPERYRLHGLSCHDGNLSHHRWTVDTPEDFELIRHVLSTLYPQNPEFTFRHVLALLDQNPEWCQLNAAIQQKAV